MQLNVHNTFINPPYFFAASAVIFFVLEDFLLIHITLQGLSSLTKASVAIKIISAVVACLSTFVRRILLHFLLEIVSVK